MRLIWEDYLFKIWYFALMVCDLELFTFADKWIRGDKDTKYCFLVDSVFLCRFCVALAFLCVQLDTGLVIFQLIFCQKVCHYLGGDMGGGRSRKTVIMCDKGGCQKLVVGGRHTFWMAPIYPSIIIVSYSCHQTFYYITLQHIQFCIHHIEQGW